MTQRCRALEGITGRFFSRSFPCWATCASRAASSLSGGSAEPGTLFGTLSKLEEAISFFLLDNQGHVTGQQGDQFSTFVRTYAFKTHKQSAPLAVNYLMPPFGSNLGSLIIHNKELRQMVSDFFKAMGYKIQVNPIENEIRMVKDVNDQLYSYPYHVISETMQRIIFYQAAIRSNSNSTIILDEPEAHTFPMYTKMLAETIALDQTNQFFISTHSPYLLMNIIEKTKQSDLSISLCRMEESETTVHPISEAKFGHMLDLGPDVFFNLDQLIDK